eukprot:15431877-Alexandrium_andersonii.AAC.1
MAFRRLAYSALRCQASGLCQDSGCGGFKAPQLYGVGLQGCRAVGLCADAFACSGVRAGGCFMR